MESLIFEGGGVIITIFAQKCHLRILRGDTIITNMITQVGDTLFCIWWSLQVRINLYDTFMKSSGFSFLLKLILSKKGNLTETIACSELLENLFIVKKVNKEIY